MSSTWRLWEGHGDSLLVQHAFGPEDYSVSFTDLSSVWTESLTRNSIVTRSIELETSIDAVGDVEQRRLMLTTIEKALKQEPNTNASFSSNDNGGYIELRVTIALHASLRPMEWIFKLRKCPQNNVTVKIVLPLLADRARAHIESASLLRQLKDKDALISKLMTQMQADGSDMSKIFPGSLASRSSSKNDLRRHVGRSVKAVAEFDESLWRDHISKVASEAENTHKLLLELSPLSLKETPESMGLPENNPWWSWSHQQKHALKKQVLEGESTPPPEERGASKTGDAMDFQRQMATPEVSEKTVRPNDLSAHDSHERQGSTQSASTTDDSDGDLKSSTKQYTVSTTSRSYQNQIAEIASPEVEGKGRYQGTTDSDGNSMDLDEPVLRLSHPASELRATGAQGSNKSKPKLGKIGGKRQGVESQVLRPIAIQHSMAQQTPPPRAQAGKQQSPVPTASVRGRIATPAQETSPPRETSQERANRKRENLKRELDAKNQAAVKKKRKF